MNNSSTASTTGASPVLFTGSVPSVFSNEEFGSVRVIVKDNGEPLFCLKDVATCPGYANPADAVSTKCDPSCVCVLQTQHVQSKIFVTLKGCVFYPPLLKVEFNKSSLVMSQRSIV